MSQTVIFQPVADKALARAQDEAFNQGVEACAQMLEQKHAAQAEWIGEGRAYHKGAPPSFGAWKPMNTAATAYMEDRWQADKLRALKRPTAPADEGEAVDAAAERMKKGEG